MSSPVLVVITADRCPACKNYKSICREKFISAAKKIPNLRVKEFDVPSPEPFDINKAFNLETGQKAEGPADLRNYLGWYPSFALFSGSSWDSNGKLQGVVMNGTVVDGKVTKQQGGKTYVNSNPEQCLEWLNANLGSVRGMVTLNVPQQPYIATPTVGNNACNLRPKIKPMN